MTRPSTVVEEATDEIAFRIASGAYPAGTKLPSVRDLARELSINPSTVQVVLGRLQAAGLVDAHQRVGFVVRDIRLLGGIETWRYLFRFAQRLPDLAARMLEDVLAIRLMLLGNALHQIAAKSGRFDPAPVEGAIDRLELLITSDNAELDHVAHAELHALRMVIATAGQGVGLAVYNSVGEMILGVPEVVQALYATPAKKVDAWRALVLSWREGKLTGAGVDNIVEFVRRWDVGTVKRFRDLVAEEQRPARTRRKRAASA